MSRVTAQQEQWLLTAIQPHRVRILDGQSYLPQHDVRAHLIRIFGFCGHSVEVVETALAFEEKLDPYENPKRRGEMITNRWNVVYRATVRLTVFREDGTELAHWEDSATGDAQKQHRPDGHDLALKSAVSTALKRAATNLGDQFGLSLYNKDDKRSPFVFRLLGQEDGSGTDIQVPAASEEDVSQDPDDQAQPHSTAVGAAAPPRATTDVGQALPVSRQFAAWVAASVPEWAPEQTRDKVMAGLIDMGAPIKDLSEATDAMYLALRDKWRDEGFPLDPPAPSEVTVTGPVVDGPAGDAPDAPGEPVGPEAPAQAVQEPVL